MEKTSSSVRSQYEKLFALFSKHPGPINQYSDLRKMLRKCGFKSSVLFRGKDFVSDKQAGRYEIWIDNPGWGNGKDGHGPSLGDAVSMAVSSCHIYYEVNKKAA